ncbi:membrane protein YqaA with SNARE-associated domain [Azomonas agilis]|uniref:Membrane protein YqaA with SNARE-associated domain n=1 Tax=Azomonas agilis TaxID=116849 RepID=A0A562IYW9_9GAMM|nr:YqaA family protein [Azomonas agilis]TWH76118.1 membrane protein YqaA with SNARE-associated domain [Azomonas agilis]
MLDFSVYAGLFLAAFGAATLLPLQSEALLVSLLLATEYSVTALVLVATLGNVLGSVVNWWLGVGISRWQDRPWFPVSPQALQRASRAYQKYGYGSLLLSWLPIVGDPLTLIAGVLREPLWRFLLLVTLAKAGRYLILAAITLHWS